MKEFFETIFLLAALQGILLSLILFTRKENHDANIVLGIATFTLSLNLFSNYYYSTGLFRSMTWFMGITYPFPLLFGPIFYIYTRLVSKKDLKFNKKHLLHFIPVLLVYISIMHVFFYSPAEKIAFVEKMMVNDQALIYFVIEAVIPIQGLIYTILLIKIVAVYSSKIKDSYSNIDRINLNWLVYIMYGMIIIWTIVAMAQISNLFSPGNYEPSIMLHLSISILIYSIGYMGLKQPEIFTPAVKEETRETLQEKYKKSGLDDKTADNIKNKLIDVMQSEKPYINTDLTLNKLADMLAVSPHNLSEVINSRFNQNYYDFVNSYRVEEFKRRLFDPVNSNYSLLGIALDSGFKSKTTFNNIFKKYTGMTPSEYKKSCSSEAELR